MRFDDAGLFYVPDIYKRDKKVGPREKPLRAPPPIPDTGWRPQEDFRDLSSSRVIAFDTETYDPDLKTKGPGARRGGYLVGVSLAVEGWSRYFPIAHSMGGNLDKAKVIAYVKEQLKGKQLKVGANLLYDLDFLSYEGIKVGGRFFDVLYADPLIYEYHTSYSLEAVTNRWLKGRGKNSEALYQWCSDAFGGPPDDSQRANIWRAPVELVGPYAESDSALPLEIAPLQAKKLDHMMQREIANLEFSLIPLLLQMRRHGVRIDLKRCEEVDGILTKSIDEQQGTLGINVYAAEEIASLCKKEGIDFPRTALGNPSFTKAWLNAHPSPKLKQVSALRKLYKLRDAFVRGALLGSHVNGRVHCVFHPLRTGEYGAVSGRFSSSNPNLQQIPSRDKHWAPIIRSCFVPEEGDDWLKNDLSQIEFRLGVHYGVGPSVHAIREMYRSDVNTSFYKVAQQMTDLDYDVAKSLSLGSLYGMGLDEFSNVSGIPIDQARPIFYGFHRKLPFMKDTYNHYSRHVHETKVNAEHWTDCDGWVRTIGERLCHLQEGFEHKALNRLLQGSCADWIKRAMRDAYQAGIFDVIPLLLTVHDELDTSKPRTAEALEAARELKELFTSAYTLNIPVLTSSEIGSSWGTLQKVQL